MRITKLLDDAIYAVSPGWGARRINRRRRQEFTNSLAELTRLRLERKKREYAGGGGFASAENSTDAHSWLKSRLSPDSALEEDRQEMIERADSAYKNYELATSHVEGRVIRVAGCGLNVDPDIDPDLDEDDAEVVSEEDAERWGKRLRRLWDRQVEFIGRRGEQLWEVQQMLQRYYERRGEWFLLIGDRPHPLAPTTLTGEVIHPDRVSTPDGKEGNSLIRMGIQLNEDGDAVGCHVRDTHPGDTLNWKQTWTYYPYYDRTGMPRMLHHFRRVDEGQHRGYPQYQVGTRRLKNAEEYGDAELERNYVGACHAAFVRSDLGLDEQMAAHSIVTDSDGRQVRDINPAMIHYIGQTDEVQFSDPSGAPQSFDMFMEYEGRMFAVGAGSPYELIAGKWHDLAYNSARIVWNQEEATIDVLQLGLAKAPIWLYRHFVTRLIESGQIDIDPVLYRSQPWLFWGLRPIPPARMSLDPSREDRNELIKIEAGIMPHGDMVERKTGQAASKIYRRIKRNRADMEVNDIDTTMPQMGRDEVNAPTQPGDKNQESSDANEDRQAVGA